MLLAEEVCINHLYVKYENYVPDSTLSEGQCQNETRRTTPPIYPSWFKCVLVCNLNVLISLDLC